VEGTAWRCGLFLLEGEAGEVEWDVVESCTDDDVVAG
jgi:hypothetical protein